MAAAEDVQSNDRLTDFESLDEVNSKYIVRQVMFLNVTYLKQFTFQVFKLAVATITSKVSVIEVKCINYIFEAIFLTKMFYC